MLIHYFFDYLDIGQVTAIFINLYDFMHPTALTKVSDESVRRARRFQPAP
jgi:hypothetical protein